MASIGGPSTAQQPDHGTDPGSKRGRFEVTHTAGPSGPPAAKKAKMDALWQQLQSKAGAKQAPKSAAHSKPMSLQAQLDADPRASSLGGLSAIIAGLQSKKGPQHGTAASKPGSSSGLKLGLSGLPSSKQVGGTDANLASVVRAASKLVKPVQPQGEDPTAQAPPAAPEPTPAKPALTGLDAALAGLQQKKTTVLGNTKQDWKQFKAADADVNEELESYKKSNNKYLDKVNFLKRAELLEYERERDERAARRPMRSDVPGSS